MGRLNFKEINFKKAGILSFILVIYLPIIYLVFNNGIDFEAYKKLINLYKNVIFFTIKQAFLSAFLITFIAFFLSFLLKNRLNFKEKELLSLISLAIFSLPSTIISTAFIFYFGREGVLNTLLKVLNFKEQSFLYNEKIIILANLYYNILFLTSLILNRIEFIEKKYLKVAALFNKNKLKLYKDLMLPLITPTLLRYFIFFFFICFNNLTVILFLSGKPYLQTIESTIYYNFNLLKIKDAIFLMQISFVINLILSLILYRQNIKINFKEGEDSGPRESTLNKFILPLVLILFLSPLLSLIYKSFSLFSLEHLKRDFYTILNSINLANISLIFTLFLLFFLMLIEIKNKFTKLTLILRLSISPIVYTFGIKLLFEKFNFNIYIIIGLSNALIYLPIVLKLLFESQILYSQELKFNAKVFSKNSLIKIIKIDFPIMLKYLSLALILVYVYAINESSNSITYLSYKRDSINSRIFNLFNSYEFERAYSLIFILILLNIISIKLLQKGINYANRGKS